MRETDSIGQWRLPRQLPETYRDTPSSTCGYGGSCCSAGYSDYTGSAGSRDDPSLPCAPRLVPDKVLTKDRCHCAPDTGWLAPGTRPDEIYRSHNGQSRNTNALRTPLRPRPSNREHPIAPPPVASSASYHRRSSCRNRHQHPLVPLDHRYRSRRCGTNLRAERHPPKCGPTGRTYHRS